MNKNHCLSTSPIQKGGKTTTKAKIRKYKQVPNFFFKKQKYPPLLQKKKIKTNPNKVIQNDNCNTRNNVTDN